MHLGNPTYKLCLQGSLWLLYISNLIELSALLWVRFYTDSATWTVDRQFLWGRNFLITPVLDPVSQYLHRNLALLILISDWAVKMHALFWYTCMYGRHQNFLIFTEKYMSYMKECVLEMLQISYSCSHAYTHSLTSTGKTWHGIFFVALSFSHPSLFSLSYSPSFLSALMRALTSLPAD